jgi:hypothetical protein
MTGSLVAGLPRPGTLILNALRLQLEARLVLPESEEPGYEDEGYPSKGNVEWFSPLESGCLLFLAVDLERCLRRSPSGRSVIIANAAFRAPLHGRDKRANNLAALDIAITLSCMEPALRSRPPAPPAAPSALPAAVEDNPVWPHAWRAAAMAMHGENVGVIIEKSSASADAATGGSENDPAETFAAARKRRKLQRVVLPKGRSVSQRSGLTAAATQRIVDQRQRQLFAYRQAAVQSLKLSHEAARSSEKKQLQALQQKLVAEAQDRGWNRADQVKQQMALWNLVHDYKDKEDGREVSEIFKVLPDREEYPDYCKLQIAAT